MSTTIKDRIKELAASLKMGQNKFEKDVGFSNGYINNLKSEPSPSKLEKILYKYPEVNRTWLLTGNGEMLKSNDSLTLGKHEYICDMIPLLPISAQGGSLDDFIISIKDSDCERVISPIKGADFAITVAGDSMIPGYQSGSQILIKKINDKAFIEWGKVYVLDTCNGVVIKEVYKGDSDSELKCVSTNSKYEPFFIQRSDVYGMYRVMMCMSLK